ncbi:hypothetical protein KDN32_03740 [Nocardioides sp. J2M5]|uniref:hypothetical protein n=1 Tax=Nocardioides palaemonis TaxID=2829810 RepID=UPI001BA95739|nr:hypothetical protein [Nocardioides palaemonis]MBS2936854.1 hypothetical protein [Nocardioides palaemonis]
MSDSQRPSHQVFSATEEKGFKPNTGYKPTSAPAPTTPPKPPTGGGAGSPKKD